MAVNQKFERLKKVIGGIRSDVAPTTNNGDPVALRVNSSGELITGGAISSGTADDGSPSIKIGAVVEDVPTLQSDGAKVDLITDLYSRLRVLPAGFDETTDVIRTASTNQEADRKCYNALASITNSADGTFDYYIDLEGCNSFTLYYNLNGGLAGATAGVTMTLWGSIQDDGTADSSCLYVDITNDLVGAVSIVAAPTVTASGLIVDDGGFCRDLKYVRVRIIAVSTTSSADWILQSRHKVRF